MNASLAVVTRLAASRRPEFAVRTPGRCARGRAPSVTQRGIARVELAFVLIALAALAAVSVPSFGNLVVAERLRSAGADLVASLELARSEAIRRSDVVTVRPIADRWTGGWVVATARGDSIDRRSALGGRVAVPRAPDSIAFGPDGLPGVGGVRIQLADADRTTGVASRCVIVDPTGRPRIEAKTCE